MKKPGSTPTAAEPQAGDDTPLRSVYSLAGWPETFGKAWIDLATAQSYETTTPESHQDTLSKQPPGPALFHGVTIVRNDLLPRYLNPNSVPAGPTEFDFTDLRSENFRAAVQNLSGEIIYLVPEDSIEPVVLLPGYTALNIDGFVSALQYNLDVDENYYKVTPGMLVIYKGSGEVDAKSILFARPAGDFINLLRRKELSGWVAYIPFKNFRENLENLGILRVR